MRIFPSTRHESARRRWVQAGLLLISLAVVVLFGAALGPRSYAGPLSSPLLALVLIALCVAIVLHVRFLILTRHEHRETASVLETRRHGIEAQAHEREMAANGTTAIRLRSLKMRWPNSLVLENSASRCSGCGFIVSRLNKVLSISVTVRLNSWWNSWPS